MDINQKEEEILKILWKREKAFVKEIIEDIDEDPKPPYNTVSSIIRRMVDKKLVAYNAFGKTHQYFSKISKDELKRIKAKQLLSDYFDNSLSSMVSYFVKKENLDNDEMLELLKKIKDSE